MIWNMIQRTVRGYLKAHQHGLPSHCNIPSDNITTRFLFELFPQIQTVPISNGSQKIYHLAGLGNGPKLVCKALGTRISEFEKAR
jgi:hypothetical protein